MRKKSKNNLLIFILGLCYILGMGLFSYWKFVNLRYTGLDLGIFDNALFNTLEGNFFRSTTQPPSFFAYHFSPILLVYLPLYALFRHPLTLIFIENIFFALSLWPLSRLIKNILSEKWIIPLSLVWLLSPWLINASLYEFHAIALFPFFIFWSIFFYREKRLSLFLIFLFLALLIREDVAFVALSWSLLALIERREKKWIFIPLLFGVGYFFLSLLIIRSFSSFPSYAYLTYYSWIGSSWQEIIKTFLFDPWKITEHLVSFRSLIFILVILLPFGFLPLLKWRYLLIHLFTFVQLALMGDGPSTAAFKMHYVVLFLPGIFWSFFLGIQKIQNGVFGNYKKLASTIAVVGIFYGIIIFGPLMSFFENRPFFLLGTQKEKVELLSKIPQDAKILVSDTPLPFVSTRKDVYLLRYLLFGKTQYGLSDFSLPPDTQFVLIDTSDIMFYEAQYRNHPLYKEGYKAGALRFRKFLQDGNFVLQDREGAWILWEKDIDIEREDEKYLWKTHTTLPKSLNISFPQNKKTPLSLLSFEEKKEDDVLSLNLFWKKERDIHENYAVLMTFQNKKDGTFFQYYELLGAGIFPTSDWSGKNIIETRHQIPLKEGGFSGVYSLEVSIFRFSGGLELDNLGSPHLVLDSMKILGGPYKFPPLSL